MTRASITASAPVQAVLDRIHNPKPTKQGWQAKCPAHDAKGDKSLSIKYGKY